jgi:hypothetical protein
MQIGITIVAALAGVVSGAGAEEECLPWVHGNNPTRARLNWGPPLKFLTQLRHHSPAMRGA